MPFVTEELWDRLVEVGVRRENLLCLSAWPVFEGLADADADEEIGWLIKLVSEVRSVRSEMNVPAGSQIALVLVGAGKAARERAERHEDTIKRLARLENMTFSKTAPKGSAQIVLGETTVALPLAGVIDMGAERARLAREIEKSQAEIRKIDAKLANAQFVAKAPAEVVEESRERRAGFEATMQKLQAALKRVEAAA
jgi:valyl-tRNA synthetase